ncbi:TonB-dependent receptor [Flavivirga abyssicola]|uniref:SusC/RagA family TonB-linked outer membrane protein n=1 Tax=Flavivirga abyssicola TaxID=3063533 RepID=UPI0026DF9B3F|nr:TonB-dependent receptor [Flavivirga sp. MEBiC07777]WVK14771.1 TonB-dependent receptor [Flavivirga sp. MEBiC07777]
MKLLKLLKQKCQHRIFMLTMVWLTGIAIGHSQNLTITGSIIDESGQPLAGANILIKGTSNGTQNDFDGLYSISAASDATLVVSYIGFITQEIEVNGRTTINITLIEDSSQLDEVIIVGYGAQKKSDLTGAIATVSGKDIDNFTFTDASQALQGRMAGVSVQSSGGAPGAGANITIRGTSTFTDIGPLFVIDGMITSSMATVNPSDIDTISVLKDASALAIYGSRAANGVVIITTKKGTRGKVSINLDTNYGVQKVINTFDWANARQYADIVNAANDNDGTARFPANDGQFDPNYSSDLYGESLRSASIQNTNLRIAGGGENTLFSLSFNDYDQEGIVKYSDFKRTTVRANGSFTKGRFKLESTIGLTRTVNNPNPFFNKERNLIPTVRLRNDAGEWSASDLSDRGITGTPAGFYGAGTLANELALAALEDRTVTRNTVLGNVAGSFEIFNGLTYKLNVGLESYTDNNYRFSPDEQVIYDGTTRANSELTERNSVFLSTLVEHTLNYKKTFNKHTIDIIGGTTEQINKIRTLGATSINFPNNDVRVVSAGEVQSSISQDATSVIQSYFGRLNYTFDNRYIITASIRRDGSSLFKDGLRWGDFPSAAIGWNISNEKFMENFDVLTNIKLRAGYGEIGSNNVAFYQTDAVLNLFSDYVVGGTQERVNGYAITNSVNPFITWETTKTTNIGLEFNALKSKLSVTMDYFIKESEDILLAIPLSFITGTGNDVPRNVGSIENKGFEFLATYRDQIGDLSFSATGNFSILNNEVTSLGGGSPIDQGSFTSNTIFSTRTDVGQPVGSFYGFVVDGIYQTDAEATAANDGPGTPRAGDLRFKDIAGADGSGPDGAIDENDRTYLGNPAPDFEYGINLTAEYKNFDLNLFFNGVSGNTILNGTKYRGYFDTEGNYLADALNAWTPTNTNTNIPRNTQSDPGFNRRMSTFYLESGAYFRLRNAQVGYSLPNTILEKIKLEKVRFYVSAINLFTITNYTGYYPEVGRNNRGSGQGQNILTNSTALFNAGVDEGSYPTPRTFQLGLQVSF